MSYKPPLRGLAGVAVLDGVQLLNAKLRRRIAPEGSGAVRRIPFEMHQGEFAETPRCPLWGKCREAAKGVPLVFLTCYHSTNHTPSVRPFGLPAPPSGSQGIVRIRPTLNKTVTAYRKPLSQPLRAASSPFRGAQIPKPRRKKYDRSVSYSKFFHHCPH